MNIIDVKLHTGIELIAALRKVTMLEDQAVTPYRTALIQVTDMETDVLMPPQLYLLRSEFEKVRDLRWSMLDQHGIDILRLADTKVINTGSTVALASHDDDRGSRLGYVEFTIRDEVVTLLPPVIEVWQEANKKHVNIINDGMHRCWLARTSWITPAVVRIEKIPREHPYYAYPVVDGWAGVSMINGLTPDLIKKYHRRPDYKRFYRNFNSAFINVGGPRGNGEADGRGKQKRGKHVSV